MKRGEIYYIHMRPTVGAEISKARPAVIVSNNALNQTSDVVEVVYLTTQPKKELPTHAFINATGVESTVLCEQIDTVSTLLVGDYCATCSADEMLAIDHGLRASLDLAAPKRPRASRVLEVTETDRRLLDELRSTQEERDRYARMLDMLMAEREAQQ